MINVISGENFEEAKKCDIALIDFSATWCGPCKMLAPIMENLSEEFAGQVDFFSCDVDENPNLAFEFKVVSIPTVIILKKGEVIARETGFQPKPAMKQMIMDNIK